MSVATLLLKKIKNTTRNRKAGEISVGGVTNDINS